MNDKYIIKNCPARLPKSGFCIEAPKKKAYLCQDCTDCKLKQIVELCKEAQEIMDKEKYYEDDFDTFSGESIMAEKIMNMLDIEECE